MGEINKKNKNNNDNNYVLINNIANLMKILIALAIHDKFRHNHKVDIFIAISSAYFALSKIITAYDIKISTIKKAKKEDIPKIEQAYDLALSKGLFSQLVVVLLIFHIIK